MTDRIAHRACYGHPAIPAGMPASRGPAKDCIVDKIQEFAAELADPATNPEEQIAQGWRRGNGQENPRARYEPDPSDARS